MKQKYHLFVLLDQGYTPEQLKLALKHWNLKIPEFRKHISLTRTKNTLRWPLDITVCQNDKLIYIAPPICKDGVRDTLGKDRIKLIRRSKRFATLEGLL